MNKKKEKEPKTKVVGTEPVVTENYGQINSKEELKTFLNSLHDRLSSNEVAPIYGLQAINHVMNLSEVYGWLDSETKELARGVWLKVETSGVHVDKPPMLFG